MALWGWFGVGCGEAESGWAGVCGRGHGAAGLCGPCADPAQTLHGSLAWGPCVRLAINFSIHLA